MWEQVLVDKMGHTGAISATVQVHQSWQNVNHIDRELEPSCVTVIWCQAIIQQTAAWEDKRPSLTACVYPTCQELALGDQAMIALKQSIAPYTVAVCLQGVLWLAFSKLMLRLHHALFANQTHLNYTSC